MKYRLSLAALALASTAALPAWADSLTTSASSAGSSASSAGSASLRGSSDSISSSSGSGAKDKTAMVKDGDYRVAAVAPTPAQPHKLRLSLEPQGIAQAEPFQLDVPLQALGGAAPAVGEIVQARQRAYGVQFARAAVQEPFFLVLADAWDRQMDSRPVTP